MEAKNHVVFAFMSEAAYGKTPAAEIAQQSNLTSSSVSKADIESQKSTCPDSEHYLNQSGWNRWPDFLKNPIREKIQGQHLRVEVWQRNEPLEVAVVFGGTVLNNKNDLMANIRWFLPKEILGNSLDEYSAIVQQFAPEFIIEWKRRLVLKDITFSSLQNARLFATGHSLGAGLAQQFAYSLPRDQQVPRVTHVYAFDPSPVTGRRSAPPDIEQENSKFLFTDRIYQRGELLAHLRSLTSIFIPQSERCPVIRYVRYDAFESFSPIYLHSIKKLACGILSIANAPMKDSDGLGISETSYDGRTPMAC